MRIEFEWALAGLSEELDKELEKAKNFIKRYSAFLTSTMFLSVSIFSLTLTAVGASTSPGAMIYLIPSSLLQIRALESARAS